MDKRGALPYIRIGPIGPQKIHNKLHAPTGLLIDIYSPMWLESKDALCLKHGLCPKSEATCSQLRKFLVCRCSLINGLSSYHKSLQAFEYLALARSVA